METQENSQESSENQLKLDETDNPSNTTLGNLSVKYQNYYQQLIELTKNNVKPLRLISLKK